MNLKYKLSPTWLSMGGIWFVLSIFLFLKYLPTSTAEYSLIRIITLVILPALLATYYLFMPLISYAKITEDKIIIHKSMVIFNFKIQKSNIETCRVLNRDIVFFTKDEKVYSIHLDWVKREELIKFIKILQTFIIVYDGNTKQKINFDKIL